MPRKYFGSSRLCLSWRKRIFLCVPEISRVLGRIVEMWPVPVNCLRDAQSHTLCAWKHLSPSLSPIPEPVPGCLGEGVWVCVRERFEGWKHSRLRKQGLPTDNYRGKRVWLRVVTTLTLGKYDAEPNIQPGFPAAPFPLTHLNAQIKRCENLQQHFNYWCLFAYIRCFVFTWFGCTVGHSMCPQSINEHEYEVRTFEMDTLSLRLSCGGGAGFH